MKKLFKVFMLLCFAHFSNSCFSQQNDYGKVWLQGGNEIFTTEFLGNQVVNTMVDSLRPLYFTWGHSSICDAAGNLILASNTGGIYGKNNQTIDNGDTVTPFQFYVHEYGGSSYSQSSIFLPVGNDIYYNVTATASDYEMLNHWQPGSVRALFDLLLYNVIDMKANGGAGRVVKRMKPLMENARLSKVQMMACRHGNGKDWWLLKQGDDSNIIYSFRFTKDSVYGPFVQGFSEPHFGTLDLGGQSMFSQDGSRYATTMRGARKVFIADFDRCSGILSNPKVYDVPALPMHDATGAWQVDSFTEGLCFAPNGQFLYVNGYANIQQLDLNDTNAATQWYVVAGLDTTWAAFQQYSSMYPGPDNKLYVGNWNGLSGQMSVINSPDVKGAGCDFCPRCLRFPPLHYNNNIYHVGAAQPPCMPNYKLGGMAPCDSSLGLETAPAAAVFKLYPNPANGTITIESEEGGMIEFYDMLGRVVSRAPLQHATGRMSIELHLPAGVYTYRHLLKGVPLHAGKLVIIQ